MLLRVGCGLFVIVLRTQDRTPCAIKARSLILFHSLVTPNRRGESVSLKGGRGGEAKRAGLSGQRF